MVVVGTMMVIAFRKLECTHNIEADMLLIFRARTPLRPRLYVISLDK